VTLGDGHDRIDFEDGAWVHRIAGRQALPMPDIPIPPHIWAHASTVLSALQDIASRRPVTAVYAPIWDCEGIAICLDGGFPLALGLQTTLHFWLNSHAHIATDDTFQRDFAEPMLALEERLLHDSDSVHAISEAIARDVSHAYNVPLGPERSKILPIGLDDWSRLPSKAPAGIPDGSLRLLFVGRLEARKGIDVLLEVLPCLLSRHPNVYAEIVGNDRIPGPNGKPYRNGFEAVAPTDLLARVRFHGEVAEDQLRGFYRICDIFVAPSRFESFGLILVEAMMFGKPVVTCRTGGIVEIAEEGRTALFAEPGDPVSLKECLERLIRDPLLRVALGSAGRKRYEDRFTPGVMAEGVVALLRQARARHVARVAAPQP
jgi:glycosyltransferase involved in cell wall biosynthesis